MAIAVTTMPSRCLSFQVLFTGFEVDDTDEPNVHGGAMWARMPITALVGDTPLVLGEFSITIGGKSPIQDNTITLPNGNKVDLYLPPPGVSLGLAIALGG